MKTKIHGTQGGGTVIWDGYQHVFVDPPKDFPEFKRGSRMPDEWGIAGDIEVDIDSVSDLVDR